ncbi:MAG: hypothetical protein HZA01_17025 [Nitrospinae bacterium]|nr:hypothetical protein [Nitrospinota bacterium]
MSKKDIRKFCDNYKRLENNGTYRWKILDETLLGICDAYPSHTSADEVFSKVALINRSYRANLHFTGKDTEEKIAKAFVKKGLDKVLAP